MKMNARRVDSSQATRESAAAERGRGSGTPALDGSPRMLAQRQGIDAAFGSAILPPQARAVVQRAWDPAGAIGELRRDEKGKAIAAGVLPRVNLYKFDSCQFNNPETKAAEPRNLDGLTIPSPYVTPPEVNVSSALGGDPEAAAVIFHEATHAFDDKTPPLEHTSEAVAQDLENEKNTWIAELEYRIRQGGAALEAEVGKGNIVKADSGGWAVNLKQVEKSFEGSAERYKRIPRTERFKPENYVWGGRQKIDVPEEK